MASLKNPTPLQAARHQQGSTRTLSIPLKGRPGGTSEWRLDCLPMAPPSSSSEKSIQLIATVCEGKRKLDGSVRARVTLGLRDRGVILLLQMLSTQRQGSGIDPSFGCVIIDAVK
jgi:hypothetical protein